MNAFKMVFRHASLEYNRKKIPSHANSQNLDGFSNVS